MPTSPISLLPQVQDLKIYGGDGVDLEVVVSSADGEPVELTGTIAAQIRTSRTTAEVAAVFAVDLTDAAQGVAYLSLSGGQTASLHSDATGEVTILKDSFKGVWDCQWSPNEGEPITLLQGSVESSIDVTRLP